MSEELFYLKNTFANISESDKERGWVNFLQLYSFLGETLVRQKLRRSQGLRLKFQSSVLKISVFSDILHQEKYIFLSKDGYNTKGCLKTFNLSKRDLFGLYSSENLSYLSLYIGLNVKFEEKKVAKFGLVLSSKGFSLFWLRAVIMPLPISPITKTNNNFQV